MAHLKPGANAPITYTTVELIIPRLPGIEMDVSAFTLYEDGKVRGDGDICLFKQPEIAGGAVQFRAQNTGSTLFDFHLDKVPSDVKKIVVNATLEGRSFDGIGDVVIIGTVGTENLQMTVPTTGRTESALILAEVYRHNGGWKVRNVSQGFNGGLADLATHFGIEVAEEEPAAAGKTVDLEKRLVDLEKKAPEMVSLVKSVGVSLEKRGQVIPKSKVCLCLDISGSMSSLFRSGKIDTLVQRALALGLTFDDDGEIDVFLFGRNVHAYGTVNAGNYTGFSVRALKDHPLEGGTRYGAAMEMIRNFYAPDFSDGLPVFVFFVTDGSTDDKPKTLKMLKESADEPIFWKYMGLVKEGRFAARRTGFLQELDDLPGRTVDNADFFNVTDPSEPTPDQFYGEVLEEFPEWMAAAKVAGILS